MRRAAHRTRAAHRSRSRNPLSDTEKHALVNVGMLAAAAFGIWWIWEKALNPFNPNNPIGATTNAISTAAADLWDSLTFSGPINALGNVDLPTGQTVAISSLQWATDTNGNTYTNLNGGVYQLAARGSDGNFTLTQVA